MFNKLIHLLGSGLWQQTPQQVTNTFKKKAFYSFIYSITSGREKGFSSDKIVSGHQKIGNLIDRGINIQKRKIGESK